MAPDILLLQQTAPLGSLWGDYVKTIVILAGICLLAVGTLKLLGGRLSGRIGGSSGRIRVLGNLALEPRKNLYVIRAGNTAMLIATSGDSVQFMTQLEQSDFPEEQTIESKLPADAPIFRKVTRFVKHRDVNEQI
jgi:flagellar biogenesis protein FliO